jgi:hypothetical protein
MARMSKSVLSKLGVKDGMRAFVRQAPPGAAAAIGLPTSASRLTGEFDYLHVFANTLAELRRQFTALKPHLRAGGMLWVSWPKRGGDHADTDLTLGSIIAVGYEHGLVESKTIAIDGTWSAIKFTFPKPGKRYRNSYGTLNAQRHATNSRHAARIGRAPR